MRVKAACPRSARCSSLLHGTCWRRWPGPRPARSRRSPGAPAPPAGWGLRGSGSPAPQVGRGCGVGIAPPVALPPCGTGRRPGHRDTPRSLQSLRGWQGAGGPGPPQGGIQGFTSFCPSQHIPPCTEAELKEPQQGSPPGIWRRNMERPARRALLPAPHGLSPAQLAALPSLVLVARM